MRPVVHYDGPVVRVRFLDRPNRYLARVAPAGGGRPFSAHVPNPGRMEELLLPGETEGWAVPARAAGRATAFDLVSVDHGRTRVSIDSRVGNRIARRALDAGVLPEFGPGPWRSEVRWGESRLDFGRGPPGGPFRGLIEVKCSNLKVGSFALFPDAPTVRGTRHLRELAAAARDGIAAGLLVVVQRPDVERFAPNAALDPAFAAAFRDARAAGVRVRAQRLRVFPARQEWDRPIPVEDAPPGTSL